MGAKGKYNDKTTDEICMLVSEGRKIKDICETVGISQTTYYDWLLDERKTKFTEAIKKAEGKRGKLMKTAAILSILEAMNNGQWQAGAWWLERVHNNEFGKTLEISSQHEEALKEGINGIRNILKRGAK